MTKNNTQDKEPFDIDSNPGQIRSDVATFVSSGVLIECELVDCDESVSGFPVYIGEDYLIMSRLFQYCWENGFRAIRFSNIKAVVEFEETNVFNLDFVKRARHARGFPNGPKLPFVAPTFTDLLNLVCKHYPIVVMSGETAAGKSFDFAAHVSSANSNTLNARLFILDGFWQDQEQSVPVAEIYEVFFGSEYEKTLVAMSQLSD